MSDKPIDMVLHCPNCGMQHIDEPDAGSFMLAEDAAQYGAGHWTNPPHRSHLCHGCKHVWRPADVPTNGVAAVKTQGKNDSPVAARQPSQAPVVQEGKYPPLRKEVQELLQDFRLSNWTDDMGDGLPLVDRVTSGDTIGPGIEQLELLADEICVLFADRAARAPAVRMLTDAARDVLAERQRQISAEGWTPEHDDEHDGHEMAHAAACYAYPELTALVGVKTWPWAAEWFKVRDHRSNYVRAAALLLAEIERLDRSGKRIPASGEIGEQS